jgi:CubicO group peptidase (beta-lactamase class C family)
MPTSSRKFTRRSFLKATSAATAAGALALTLRPRSTRADMPEGASKQFRAVADAVEAAMELAGVPGVALAVFGNGKEEVATFGVTDVVSGASVTPWTRFQCGSVTKPYTATAAMRLVQDGKLIVDAPVRSYIPELHLEDARTADRVTIRHLLTHSAGWWGDGFIDNGSDDQALARFVSELLPKFPQITPLGEYTSYNNAGISLLGRIIEVVTGQTYRQAMQELVLDPMGLSTTTFDPHVAATGSQALGHGPKDDDPAVLVTPLLLPRNVDPAGGIWTDIRDQVRFARAQLGDGTIAGPRVISKDALTEMQTPIRQFGDEPGVELGWSWIIVDLDGTRIITHDGATFGQAAQMFIVPEAGFAMAVLTNSQAGSFVSSRASLAAFREYLGITSIGGSPTGEREKLKALPLTDAELNAYAGRYEVPTIRFTLTPHEGKLAYTYRWLNWPGALRPSNDVPIPDGELTFVDKDVAVVGTPEEPEGQLTFTRRRDGTVGWLKLSSRLFPRVG